MPISLQNLTQIVVFKTKHLAKKHKKKLIFTIVLFIGGYIAKKKMTLGHIISLVDTVTRLVQALPLPEAPRLRNIAEYQHPSTIPLKAILDATNLDDLKRKISRKEAGWGDLKQAITTCMVLTLLFYNVNSIYFLIQNKYREQFIDLQASTQFQQSMYLIRRRFLEQIPAVFENIKATLINEFQRIQLSRVYDIEDLNQMFEIMIQKVLQNKFDLKKQTQITVVNRVSPSAKNLFTSPYQYLPAAPSVLGKVGTNVLKFMGGLLSVNEWLPQASIQVTSQRYLFTKRAYLQPLKKAANQLYNTSQVQWPNKQSRQLFQLLIEEIQFTTTSLNFTTLLKANCKYNLKILRNRLALLFQLKHKSSIKFSQLLPSLYKIAQEEFLRPNQLELREKYHASELKKAIRIASQTESQQQQTLSEDHSLQEHVLEQIEFKQALQFLEKEFELKVYNERSGVIMRPKTSVGGGSGKNEADEMKKLLGMMSSSEALNTQD